MPDPPNDPEIPGFEPDPGPPGYHADFSRFLGFDSEGQEGIFIVVRLERRATWPPIQYVGPFADLWEATRWAERLGQDAVAEFFPVVRPEDVPEGGLPDEPEEETTDVEPDPQPRLPGMAGGDPPEA